MPRALPRAHDKTTVSPPHILHLSAACPPYGPLEKYDGGPADLSMMSIKEFEAAYEETISASVKLLKETGMYCEDLIKTCASRPQRLNVSDRSGDGNFFSFLFFFWLTATWFCGRGMLFRSQSS